MDSNKLVEIYTSLNELCSQVSSLSCDNISDSIFCLILKGQIVSGMSSISSYLYSFYNNLKKSNQ